MNLAPWVTNGKDFNKIFTCENYWTYSNSYHHLMSLMDMSFWLFKWHLNNRVERVNSDTDNLRFTMGGGGGPVWVQHTIYLMLFGIVVWLRKCSYRKLAGSVHGHDCLKDGLQQCLCNEVHIFFNRPSLKRFPKNNALLRLIRNKISHSAFQKTNAYNQRQMRVTYRKSV